MLTKKGKKNLYYLETSAKVWKSSRDKISSLCVKPFHLCLYNEWPLEEVTVTSVMVRRAFLFSIPFSCSSLMDSAAQNLEFLMWRKGFCVHRSTQRLVGKKQNEVTSWTIINFFPTLWDYKVHLPKFPLLSNWERPTNFFFYCIQDPSFSSCTGSCLFVTKVCSTNPAQWGVKSWSRIDCTPQTKAGGYCLFLIFPLKKSSVRILCCLQGKKQTQQRLSQTWEALP